MTTLILKILNGNISNFVIDKHDNIIMYDENKGIRLYDVNLKKEKKFIIIVGGKILTRMVAKW